MKNVRKKIPDAWNTMKKSTGVKGHRWPVEGGGGGCGWNLEVIGNEAGRDGQRPSVNGLRYPPKSLNSVCVNYVFCFYFYDALTL